MQQWDVTIIGGGLAGLSAANYLAQAGKKVILLEQSARLGGRASTEEKEGCRFNLGGHALYKQGAGSEVLKELGIEVRGGVPNLGGGLIYQGRKYPLPFSPSAVLTSKLLSWKEKKEYVRLMTLYSKLKTDSIIHISLKEWVEKHLQSPKVQQLFYMICRLSTYSDAPALASAGAVIRQLQLSAKGALYLNGGWQTMVDQLRDKALQAGAHITCGQKVTQISGEYPHLKVTLADGTELHSRSVLSTASPKQTSRMAIDADKTYVGKLAEAMVPLRAACLDLAMAGLPNPETAFVLGMDAPLYFSNHSKAARLTDRPDVEVVHVAKYLAPGEQPDAKKVGLELEAFLDLIQPGWQNHVVTRQHFPTLIVTNGLVTAKDGYKWLKPQVPDWPGMYLAGDWCAADGLLADAALSSGKKAALAIIQKEKTQEAVLL